MTTDEFQTIASTSEGLYREKGSKFIAYAYPIDTEEDVKICLEEVRKIHPKARHHCYAFRIGVDGNRQRANDDGEPGGSAGKPILGQIYSKGVTNVVVIVVRYFGGTKLGIPGLINAYKTSTADALDEAAIITKTIQTTFNLSFGYDKMGDVMNALKKCSIDILSKDFGVDASLEIGIPNSKVEEVLVRLKALLLKVSLEEAEEREWEHVTIKEI